MQCPTTTVCCFCVPLRKALLIFGYVSLIISLLYLPVLMFLAENDDVTHEVLIKIKEDTHWEKIHFKIAVIFSVVDAALTACLLRGVHKEKKYLLSAYLHGELVVLVLSLVTQLWLFPAASVSNISIFFCDVGLNLYMLYLVYSYINTKEVEALTMKYKNQNQTAPFNV